MNRPSLVCCVLHLAVCLLLAGCASSGDFDKGTALINQGDIVDGLKLLDQAAKADPGNKEYEISLVRQKELAIERLLTVADQYRTSGDADRAAGAYHQVLAIDSNNARALAGLYAIKADIRHRSLLQKAEADLRHNDLADAETRIASVLSEAPYDREALNLKSRIEDVRAASFATPHLKAAYARPISVEFRDANLKSVLEVLYRAAGINFILDKTVQATTPTTLFLKNTSVEDAIHFLLVTNDLRSKVLNDDTVLIYPDTSDMANKYERLAVKSFYLSDVDAREAMNVLKQMINPKEIYADDKLNMLIMRDTPAAIGVAGKILANLDIPDPEVVLDVEVLEVSRNKLADLGLQFPDQISAGIQGTGGTAGTATLSELRNNFTGITQLSITNPTLAANLKDQVNEADILANPRIRVRSGKEAKIHIGDRVPVITDTSTSTGFVSQSVSYLDVGLKLNVTPRVYLDNEVGIKIGLEVSNITQQIQEANGTLAYQISTRNADTDLRLKDGETQALAGLISDQDSNSSNKVPGIGSMPIIGRLFSNNSNTANKTEIVLLITPHVVRNIALPDSEDSFFYSGTSDDVGAPPLLLATVAASGDQSTAAGGEAPMPAADQAAANTSQKTETLPSVLQASIDAPGHYQPGQKISIAVAMKSPHRLKSTSFAVTYDPALMAIDDVSPGNFFKSVDGKQALKVDNDRKQGRIVIQLSGAGSELTGTAVTITAQPLVDARKQIPIHVIDLMAVNSDGSREPAGNPLTFDILP